MSDDSDHRLPPPREPPRPSYRGILTADEIRALGFAWPPEGVGEGAYVDENGKIDLQQCLADTSDSLRRYANEANAGYAMARAAANVSVYDSEDFSDSAGEAQRIADRLRRIVEHVTKILAHHRG